MDCFPFLFHPELRRRHPVGLFQGNSTGVELVKQEASLKGEGGRFRQGGTEFNGSTSLVILHPSSVTDTAGAP